MAGASVATDLLKIYLMNEQAGLLDRRLLIGVVAIATPLVGFFLLLNASRDLGPGIAPSRADGFRDEGISVEDERTKPPVDDSGQVSSDVLTSLAGPATSNSEIEDTVTPAGLGAAALPSDSLAGQERTINGYSYDSINEDVYSVFLDSDLQNVAYIKEIDCAGSRCEVDVQFFDSSKAASSTSAFLTDINQRFQSGSEPPAIQMALTSIGKNKSGDFASKLVVMPYEPPTYEVEVVENGSTTIKYVGGDK